MSTEKKTQHISVDLIVDEETGATVVVLSAPGHPDLEPTRRRFDTEAAARESLKELYAFFRDMPELERIDTTPAGQAWVDGTAATQLGDLEGVAYGDGREEH